MKRMIGYGAAEIGINAVESFLRLYLLIYYTDQVGLAANYAGYAVALAIIWDAISDPFMGRISDRTRTRFGGRLPYMALGAPLLAITTWFTFHTPQLETQLEKGGYLLLVYLALNTAMTIISVPHAALGSDIFPDPKQRTAAYAWRTLFTIFGLMLGTAAPPLALAFGLASANTPDLTQPAAATLLAMAVIVTTAITWASCFRAAGETRPAPESSPEHGHWALIKSAFTAKSFVILIAAYMIANIGQGANSALALYYYKYRLNLSEGELQKILLLFMVVLCGSLPAWVVLSRKWSKTKLVAAGTFCLGLMSAVTYPYFASGSTTGPFVAAVLGGIFIGSIGLLDSLLADAVDQRHGAAAPELYGVYFGFWKMAAKMARALAIAFAGQALTAIGFAPHITPTAETAQALGYLFGPAVGVFFMAGAALLWMHKKGDRLAPLPA